MDSLQDKDNSCYCVSEGIKLSYVAHFDGLDINNDR